METAPPRVQKSDVTPRVYGTCGKEKKSCDDNFFVDLKLACFEKYGYLGDPGDDPTLGVPLRACYEVAQVYYQAVAKAGNPAYEAAQKDACKCYCRKPEKAK